MNVVRAGWRWLVRLSQPVPQKVPRSWLHCPICDRELVGPWPSGLIVPGMGGGDAMAPNRAELVAKCPEHGRRPFNDPEARPAFRQVADET